MRRVMDTIVFDVLHMSSLMYGGIGANTTADERGPCCIWGAMRCHRVTEQSMVLCTTSLVDSAFRQPPTTGPCHEFSDGDIYLEAVYTVDDRGRFGDAIANSRGVLLRKEQYNYIELFSVPSPDGGSNGEERTERSSEQ